MDALGRLLLHRRDHGRMGMAEHQGAGAADVIDVPAAAQILDPRPLAPADRKAQIPGQRIAAEAAARQDAVGKLRSEEHTYELQSIMRIAYAVFCLKTTTY